jgi:uncharacterized protein (TIGR00369 family)
MADAVGFDLDAARRTLAENFAPWVIDLDIRIDSLDPEGAAVLSIPAGTKIARVGGIVCGQATMALADTAMVFAISAASGGFRPMTTVGQTTTFLRAMGGPRVVASARVLKLGKTLAFGEVALSGRAGDAPCATVSSTYAILGPVP